VHQLSCATTVRNISIIQACHISPARVVQWLDHLSAMCSRAWHTQCAAGLEFNSSRVHLHKSNYVKIIPMHMMIRETIPGRQQRVRRCPV